MKNFIPFLLLITAILITQISTAQVLEYWEDISESHIQLESVKSTRGYSSNLPASHKGRLLKLNFDGIQSLLQNAPDEKNKGALAPNISLPLPTQGQMEFYAIATSMMEPGLQDKFPEIKTYILKGKSDPTAYGHLTISPFGLDAFFSSFALSESIYLKRVFKDDIEHYVSVKSMDLPGNNVDYTCGYISDESALPAMGQPKQMLTQFGTELRVFRLGMTAVGEIAEDEGWVSVAEGIAALTAKLNVYNTVLERDLALRYVLIEDQDQLIFMDSDTDPFTSNAHKVELAYENQNYLDNVIGDENYDSGIILVSSGHCCWSELGATCISGRKGAVQSGFNGEAVDLHELGHHLGSKHAWTYCSEPANGLTHASEPGGGTTLMGYPWNNCDEGLNVIPNQGSLLFFGLRSVEVMHEYINSVSCQTAILTGNTAPTVTIPNNGFYIPVSTPFELEGSATDAENDLLTYSWEQYNLNDVDFTPEEVPVNLTIAPTLGDVPLFRVWNPVNHGQRTFPQISDILNNTQTPGERLPTYSRNLKFKLFVRDDHLGGGAITASETLSFEVDGAAGPFTVTSPNTAVELAVGSSITVTWDVANTDNTNVNCQNVNIKLSINGGYDFDYDLATNTSNDGSEMVTLPAGVSGTSCRIKVEAANNIFFDISNEDFAIGAAKTPIDNIAALHLDGMDDYVDLGTGIDIANKSFTIEFWGRNDGIEGDRNFFVTQGTTSSANGLLLGFNPSAEFLFGFFGDDLRIDEPIYLDDQWHHWAAVYDATTKTRTIYQDAQYVISNTAESDFQGSGNMEVGKDLFGEHGNVAIDELRIWEIVRTAEEIAIDYDCRIDPSSTGLLAYYHFDEGTPNADNTTILNIPDATGNQTNASLHELTLNGTSSNFINPQPDELEDGIGAININIVQQPQNTTKNVDETATFTVDATPSGLIYQWYESFDNVNFTEITAATNSQLDVLVRPDYETVYYKCLVYDCCHLLYSDVAILTVTCGSMTDPTSIIGNTSPCEGDLEGYYISPVIGAVSYEWILPANWEGNSSTNFIAATVGDSDGDILVRATDACGNNTSQIALTTTVVSNISISAQPVDQTISENGNASFSVTATGSNLSYQWEYSIDNGQSFQNVDGETSNSLSLNAVQLDFDDRIYRCKISSDCSEEVYSDEALLTVNCVSTVPATPDEIFGAAPKICIDRILSYSVAAVPGATEYIWTIPSGWVGSSTSNSILVTTNSNIGQITVIAKNPCGESAPKTLEITGTSDNCQSVLHFDGIDDYLSLDNLANVDLEQDLTIAFYYKPEATEGVLFYNGNESIISVFQNDQIEYYQNGGGDNRLTRYFQFDRTDIWQHFALVRDITNGEIKYYVNGILKETDTMDLNPTSSSDIPIIGAGAGGYGDFYKGYMDEFQIWNSLKTEAEIQAMLCPPIGTEPDLIAFYAFDDGAPGGDNTSLTQFSDASMNANHATPHQMSLIGNSSNLVNAISNLDIVQNITEACIGLPISPGLTEVGGVTYNWTLPTGWSVSSNSYDATFSAGTMNAPIPLSIDLGCRTIETILNFDLSYCSTAIDFDGSNDHIEIPDAPSLDFVNTFTWAVWMKSSTTEIDEDNEIFRKDGAYRFLVQDAEKIRLWTNDGNGHVFNSGSYLNDGEWHYYVLTSDGTNRILYVDGVHFETDTEAFAFPQNDEPLIISWDNDGFDASMDELQIWNVALDAQTVEDLYNCQTDGAGTSLVLHLDFEEGIPFADNTSVTQVLDQSTFGNHGTINNMQLKGTSSNFISRTDLQGDCQNACEVMAACHATLTKELDENGEATLNATELNNGSVGCGTLTYTINGSSSVTISCDAIGTPNYTLTVKDENDDEATCITTVTVEDNLVPVVSGTLNTLNEEGCDENDASAAMTTATALVNAGLTIADNCTDNNNLNISHSDEVTSSATCLTVVTRTYTIADAAGNGTEASQIINISDGTAPVLNIPIDIIIQTGASNDPSNTGQATANDACDNNPTVNFTDVTSLGNCENETIITRTWKATDACGNSITMDQIITIQDPTVPLVPAGADQVLCETFTSLDATAPSIGTGTWSIISGDGHGNIDDDSAFDSAFSGTSGQSYTLRWTVSKTGCPDFTDEVVITFEALDLQCPSDKNLLVDNNCEAQILDYTSMATSSNTCSGLNLTQVPVANATVGLGTTLVTLTLDNGNGLSTDCTFNVAVQDDTNPSVSGSLALIDEEGCDENDAPIAMTTTLQLENGGLTISDNCSLDENLTITHSDAIVSSNNCLTILTRTYTVSDESNNATEVEQTIEISDNIDPTLSMPMDLSIPKGSSTDPSNTGQATASDICDVNPNVSFSDVNGIGNCANETIITRTWTATDVCGNSVSMDQIITLIDQSTPVVPAGDDQFICNTSTTLDATIPSIGTGSWSIISGDGNGVLVNSTANDSGFSGTLGQTYTLLWTVSKDACPDFTDDVDITFGALDLQCPTNQTVFVDSNCEIQLQDYTSQASSTSTCPGLNFAQNPAPNSTFGLGTETITITLTSSGGLSTDCTFDISIEDDTDPLAVCKDIFLNLSAGMQSQTIPTSFIDDGSSDNCSGLSLSLSQDFFDCSNVGANILTLTAEDGSGNMHSCDATVTVMTSVVLTCYQDSDSDGFGDPNVSGTYCAACPTNFVTNSSDCDDGNAAINPNATEVCDDVDNNCDGNIDEGLSQNFYQDSDGDGYGNSNVSVYECEPPSGYVAQDGDCDDEDASINPGAAEICDGIDNDCDNLVDANDPNLIDNTAPVFNTCPTGFSVVSDVNCEYIIGDYVNQASVTDNCGLAGITQSPTSGSAIDLGINAITFTAVDINGLMSTCQMEIVVSDQSKPNAVCQNINVWLAPNGQAVIAPGQVGGSSTDNCSIVNMSLDNQVFDCSNLGANIVQFTVEDGAGLIDQCNAIVTVISQQVTCYLDNDNDGFGDPNNSQIFCFACQEGYVQNNEDCNDNNENISPGIAELCDGIDNNCDGQIDEGFDNDGDGFTICEGDCDDFDAEINPSAVEICDNIDNNCDGQIDEGFDMDSDGFSICNGDCDDNNNLVFPGALELCDGIDNNCDGNVDEGFDADGDGYTICNSDCDDTDATIYPGAPELCDGIDNDCDGQIDNNVSGTHIGNIFLFTQADVDAFQNCIAVIDGNLVIQGLGITDLNALINLIEVTGDVVVNSTSLSDFSGLDNLDIIGDDLTFSSNPSLVNCFGLDNLSSIGAGLNVIQNAALQNLNGLEGLTTITGSLSILVNFTMTSLSGLDNLTTVNDNLNIINNFILYDCCPIEPLINSGVGGMIFILGNATGCENQTAISMVCAPVSPMMNPSSSNCQDCPTLYASDSWQSIVYPNPLDDRINILINSKIEKGEIVILDRLGRSVMKKSFPKQSSKLSIDVEHLPEGIYFLQLKIGESVELKKIMIN